MRSRRVISIRSRDAARTETAGCRQGRHPAAPRCDDGEDEERYAAIDAFAAGTPLNESLRALNKADPSFNPKEFVNGASMAYEMIVMAFADGDRKTLKNLRPAKSYEGFDAAIAEREMQGEKGEVHLRRHRQGRITMPRRRAAKHRSPVRIVSQLISATYDKADDAHRRRRRERGRGQRPLDIARDTRSRDPELETGGDRI